MHDFRDRVRSATLFWEREQPSVTITFEDGNSVTLPLESAYGTAANAEATHEALMGALALVFQDEHVKDRLRNALAPDRPPPMADRDFLAVSKALVDALERSNWVCRQAPEPPWTVPESPVQDTGTR